MPEDVLIPPVVSASSESLEEEPKWIPDYGSTQGNQHLLSAQPSAPVSRTPTLEDRQAEESTESHAGTEGYQYWTTARSHKSRAAVDYTPIGVEPHRHTRGAWPIATVANDSQLHLIASSI